MKITRREIIRMGAAANPEAHEVLQAEFHQIGRQQFICLLTGGRNRRQIVCILSQSAHTNSV